MAACWTLNPCGEAVLNDISRRMVVAGIGLLAASAAAGQEATHGIREWQPRTYDDGLIPNFSFELISLEVNGQLGVAVLDTETGRESGWDENAFYPLNSTFKFLLAGAILQRVERGQEQLDREIPIYTTDIVSWSPVVQNAVGGNMSVQSLCEAAMMGRRPSYRQPTASRAVPTAWGQLCGLGAMPQDCRSAVHTVFARRAVVG